MADQRLSTKKRKAEPTNTTTAPKKRKTSEKVETPSTTLTINLPTKALEDILQKGIKGATQSNLRELVTMIRDQKDFIAYQAAKREDEEFEIPAERYNMPDDGWSWKGHMRVRESHTLADLAGALSYAINTEAKSVKIFDPPKHCGDAFGQFRMNDARDATKTMEKVSFDFLDCDEPSADMNFRWAFARALRSNSKQRQRRKKRRRMMMSTMIKDRSEVEGRIRDHMQYGS